MTADSPFHFFVALDGSHLDGLLGPAGLLRFEWPSGRVRHRFYPGLSAGHNISISPDGSVGILGTFCQTVALVSTDDLALVARQSTMAFEPAPYKLRSNTHHLWEPDSIHFYGAVGDHIYRFDTHDLGRPEKIGRHELADAHEMRWDSSRRYILLGDLGGPRWESQRVSIFDLQTGTARVLPMPGLVWHVAVHPTRPVGYAATYNLMPVYHGDFAPAFVREYIMEIDLVEGRVLRHWSAGVEFPAHLNSDLGVFVDEAGVETLYMAAGASHTLVEIPLASFDEARVIHVKPPWFVRMAAWRDRVRAIIDAGAKAPLPQRSDLVIETLQATNGRIVDGAYAARVSPDGRYYVAGHRGYNWLGLYDRRTHERVHGQSLPRTDDGYHIGLHHSEIRPVEDGKTGRAPSHATKSG